MEGHRTHESQPLQRCVQCFYLWDTSGVARTVSWGAEPGTTTAPSS